MGAAGAGLGTAIDALWAALANRDLSAFFGQRGRELPPASTPAPPDPRVLEPRKEPQFEIADAKSFRHNQIWCDYFNRMHLPANTAYRDAMKEYMYRLPERTGRPEDAIVSGDVYWVQDMNPKWNDTKSYKYERVKLFSFENKAPAAERAAQQKEREDVSPRRARRRTTARSHRRSDSERCVWVQRRLLRMRVAALPPTGSRAGRARVR